MQLRYEVQPAAIGILGVGIELELPRHLGVRADFRSYLNANEVRTRIDAFPVSGPTPPPVVNLRYGVKPDIQVSTNPHRTTSLSLQRNNHFHSLIAKGNLSSLSAGGFRSDAARRTKQTPLRGGPRLCILLPL